MGKSRGSTPIAFGAVRSTSRTQASHAQQAKGHFGDRRQEVGSRIVSYPPAGCCLCEQGQREVADWQPEGVKTIDERAQLECRT